jgi:hypothetical protein
LRQGWTQARQNRNFKYFRKATRAEEERGRDNGNSYWE